MIKIIFKGNLAPFPEFDFPEEREKSRADVYLQIDSGISEKKPEDPYFYVHMGLISNNSYFTLIISILGCPLLIFTWHTKALWSVKLSKDCFVPASSLRPRWQQLSGRKRQQWQSQQRKDSETLPHVLSDSGIAKGASFLTLKLSQAPAVFHVEVEVLLPNFGHVINNFVGNV